MDLSRKLNATIELLNSIVSGEPSDINLCDAEINELFRFAESHKIANLLFVALKGNRQIVDCEFIKLFEQEYYKNIIFAEKQRYFLEVIEKTFEDAQIFHMPMKGSVIKNLYPDSSLRTSSDIDIFIGNADPIRAKQLMMELGFEAGEFGSEKNTPDTYHIDNRIHVELHKKLLGNDAPIKWQGACNIIEESLVKNEVDEFGYHMTKEDFYVYMIIHIAKHINEGGIGLRAFFDVWIYIEKYDYDLDWELIERKMDEAELEKFHNNILKLIEFWKGSLLVAPREILEFQAYIAECGAMGDFKQRISEQLFYEGEFKGKSLYYLRVVFLSLKDMQAKYRLLIKMPILLPFFWLYRMAGVLLKKRTRISKIIHRFDGADKEKGRKTASLKKDIGLGNKKTE